MKPGTEPTFIPPLEANGKAIRYIDHGVWHTIARADSRGLFVPGSDEQNAAYLCHAANLYPELVEALNSLVLSSGSWAYLNPDIMDEETFDKFEQAIKQAVDLLAKAGEL